MNGDQWTDKGQIDKKKAHESMLGSRDEVYYSLSNNVHSTF